MAHEFESGFFVNTPAWHGLGTVLNNPPSLDDGLKQAGLDWDVIPTPLMVNGDKLEGYSANVRSSDGRVLGVTSELYKVLNNRDAFSFVDELLNHNVTLESAGSLRQGELIWLLAKLDPIDIVGDKFSTYFALLNGHDGKTAVKGIITPTRIVCNNTATLAIKTAVNSWSYRHMGDLSSKTTNAQMTLNLVGSYYNQYKSLAEEMAAKTISNGQLQGIVDQLFPEDSEASNCIKKNISYLRNSFLDIYNNRSDLQNIKGTAWGVIQAASDMASHIKPLRETKNSQEKKFESFILGNNIVSKVQDLVIAA